MLSIVQDIPQILPYLPLLYRVVIPVPIFHREEINSFPRLYRQKQDKDSKSHVFDSKPVCFALSQGMC